MRWTLARPGVRLPRWGGTATDTRIAYLSSDRLRVVAGDGTGDAAAGERPPAEVAPAWRAGFGFVLAYADTSGLVDALLLAKGGQLWTSEAPGTPRSLEWSSDAEQLLVLSAGRISILDADSGRRLGGKAAADVVAAAYRPGTHAFAELHGGAGGSRITLGERTLFSSGGELRGLTWSPDGRWLLTGAPEADQWVFVRADGRGIVAVSNVSAQFHSETFPRGRGLVLRRHVDRRHARGQATDDPRRSRLARAARGGGRAPAGAGRRGDRRSSASTSSTGRAAERTRCCSCVTGAPTSEPRAYGRSGSPATRRGRTTPGRRSLGSAERPAALGLERRGDPRLRRGVRVLGMKDVAMRSAFLIEDDTVRASWLLGREMPDIDAVIAAASSL